MPRRPNRRQFDYASGQPRVPLWILSASPAVSPGETVVTVEFSGPVTIDDTVALEIVNQCQLVGTDTSPNPFNSPCTLIEFNTPTACDFSFGVELDPALFWEICVPIQWPAVVGETGGSIAGSFPPELTGADPPLPLAWAVLATPPP